MSNYKHKRGKNTLGDDSGGTFENNVPALLTVRDKD